MANLESQQSAQVFATPFDVLAPAQVTGLTHTSIQGEVVLNWNPVTTNEDESALEDLGSYKVFRKNESVGSYEQIATVDGIEVTHTDTTAKDGATYFYAVAAVDTDPEPNEGVKSADLEVKTVPSIPEGLGATPFNNMVRLDWTSVKSEGDPKLNENLEGYNIYRSETDGSGYEIIASAELAATLFEDQDVVNETPYYYVITAFDNSI